MNYKTMLKGALALSLSLIVGAASAEQTTYDDVQKYGATFEDTASGVVNDYAYALNTNITYYHTGAIGGEGSHGWYGGESDESKIVSANNGQALQLNTDAGVLTNLFAASVATDLNAGIADAGAYFETEVKFVPSDTPDAGISGGTDATKFAIYAYADENNNTTNLVVFHAYYDGNGDLDYTNEVFGAVNCDAYTTLRVEMKKMLNRSVQLVNVFSVKVGNTLLESETALDADSETPGSVGNWFMTVEDAETDSNNKLVSSLNFKGTGEIDNIKAGVIEGTTTYAIDWTGSQGVVVTNAAGETLTSADTNFVAGASIYFTANALPEGNVITNVFIGGNAIDGVTFPVTEYAYTVGAADTVVTVLAGVPAQEPQSDEFEAGDDVDGTITADQAAWLNSYIGTYTYEQLAGLTGWQDKYLLNVDPFTGAGTLTVTAITVGTDVQVTIALARTEDGTAISGNRAIKGVLKLYGTADLGTAFANLAAAEITDADFSDGNTTTATFSGNTAKFFKAVIEAPAAQE